MNQYLILGTAFNFRNLLPFDSNKALYEYKNEGFDRFVTEIKRSRKSALMDNKTAYCRSRICFYYKSFRKSKCLFSSCKEEQNKGQKHCWIV